MAIRYDQSITWTDRDGAETTISVRDFPTREEATAQAIKSATHFGWTRPKWWQWWRWNDTRPPTLDVEEKM